ncbi:MAG: hypothetical protein N3E52_03910 [Candidatus Bathyarchaeota archaeon]|nr:hypothetical protein [Candidatus Bathyarchaeota archaeon]
MAKFDERHCHKWALLLRLRRKKLDNALAAIAREDFETARRLFSEIFYGVSGKHADPGMAGSLLYHMAMVTKMETETRLLLNELRLPQPDVAADLLRFTEDFVSDMYELAKASVPLNFDPHDVAAKAGLSSEEKIDLFTKLNKETKTLEAMLASKQAEVCKHLEGLFSNWARHVAEMRLRQEYETIKGFLITVALAKAVGTRRLKDAMVKFKKGSVKKPCASL